METAPTSIEVLLRPTLGQSDEPSDLRGSLSPTSVYSTWQSPGGHPSNYEPGATLLNFSDRANHDERTCQLWNIDHFIIYFLIYFLMRRQSVTLLVVIISRIEQFGSLHVCTTEIYWPQRDSNPVPRALSQPRYQWAILDIYCSLIHKKICFLFFAICLNMKYSIESLIC